MTQSRARMVELAMLKEKALAVLVLLASLDLHVK